MRGGAKFETKGFDRVIRQRVNALAGVKLTVGIHRGKMNQGVDVALYGSWNNFGTKNAMGWELIPERTFMRFAADRIADWMRTDAYKEVLRDVARGRITPQQAIARIGAQAVQITRKTIADSALYRPNSDITIARKGSTKPLIHSGTLIQTVNYRAFA